MEKKNESEKQETIAEKDPITETGNSMVIREIFTKRYMRKIYGNHRESMKKLIMIVSSWFP